MSIYATAAGLIVAVADLAAVRAVTGAVRSNLIAAGGIPGPLGTVTMPGGTLGTGSGTATSGGDPVLRPRPIIHPEPAFAPRLVHHPVPRIEPRQSLAPVEPEQPVRCGSPLPAPWKQLPPVEPHGSVTVKYVTTPADQVRRGTILDLFI